MGVAERGQRAGFSLSFESGGGRLELTNRKIGSLVTIAKLALTLDELPSRFEMNTEGERFRHQRARLDELVLHVEDQALGPHFCAPPLRDLEIRAMDGELLCLGVLDGEGRGVPFLARARLEPAHTHGPGSLLLSFYELRLYGPARRAAPQLGAALFEAFGFEREQIGPTAALFQPVEQLLLEICAELGWKVPRRDRARLDEIRLVGGRLELIAGQPRGRPAPRRVVDEHRQDRFLEDYEHKRHYASIESQIGEGQIARAAVAYGRQLESQRGNPFVTTRLLQLLVHRPERASEAKALIRERLRVSQDDPEALIALAHLEAKRGAVVEAAAALERLARAADRRGDPMEAAQAWCGVAHLLEGHAPKEAAAAFEEALALRGDLPSAMSALADLHAAAGNWRGARRILEQQLSLDDPADEAHRYALLCKLGALSLERAEDPYAAAEYFEQALSEEGDKIEALIGLADARAAQGQLHPAARALERAAEQLVARARTEEAARMITRLGDLFRRGLSSPSAAKLRYDQALSLNPEDPHALLGLAEIAIQTGKRLAARGHLQALLRREPEALDGIDSQSLYLKLGRLLLEGPDNEPQAISYLQKALAGEGPTSEEALELLVEAHTRASRWGDLSRILEIAAARAAEPTLAARRLRRRAEIVWRHLNAEPLAERLLLEAKALEPGEPQTLARLAELYRAREDHEALAEILSERVERLTDHAQLAATYAEWGALLEGPLGRPDEAAVTYALALGCDPHHRRALDGLIDVYAAQGRYGEQVELLRRRADLGDAHERAQDLKAAAEIAARRLGQPLAALRDLEAALAAKPEDEEILERLMELRRAQGDDQLALNHAEALMALQQRKGTPSRKLLGASAELNLRLGRLESALGWLERWAERAPLDEELRVAAERLAERAARDLPGSLEESLGLLERLSAARPRAEAAPIQLHAARLLIPTDQAQAARRLDALLVEGAGAVEAEARALRVEIATAREEWSVVAEALQAELRGAPPEARPARLTALAELAFARLEQPDEGLAWAKAALAEAPTHRPALLLLSERAFELGEWATAHDAYTRLAAEAPQTQRYALKAGLCALYSGDARAAVAHLEPLQTEDPTRIIALTEALLALGDPGPLARVLDARLRHPAEDALLRELGRALHAEAPSAAARCWRRLLDQAPDDPEAIAALESPTLEAPAVQPQALLGPPTAPPVEPLLDAPIEYPAPPPKETANRITSGRTARHLEEEEDSLPPSALPPPEAPLEDSQREALEEIDAALEAADGDAEAAALALRKAELQRDQLHDPQGAIPLFEQVLDLAPPGDPSWMEALEALEDLHTINEAWSALLALYDRRVAAGMALEEEIRPLKASVLRTMGDMEAALAELEGQARPEAVELKVSLCEELGQPREAAETLLFGVEDLDKSAAAHRRWRAADHLVAAGDFEEALSLLQVAYAALEDQELLEAWLELAKREGGDAARAEAQIAHAETLDDSPHQRVRASRLFLEAARWLDEEAPARARALYERALERWPENVEALSDLGALLERLGESAAWALNLQRRIKLSLAGEHRAAMALQLARLWIALEADDDVDPEEGAALAAAEMAMREGDDDVQRAAQALLYEMGVETETSVMGLDVSGTLPSGVSVEIIPQPRKEPGAEEALDDELLDLMADLGMSEPES